MLVIGVLAVAAAGLVAWKWAAAPSIHRGPVVIVCIDTLRADRLPAYGYAKIQTPAIEALRADGVLFEQAWAHSPLTLPSHASILTGRLPFEHGVRDNLGFTLKPGEATLAEMLKSRGYSTGGFVSAYVLRAETGIGRGFDTYDARLPASSPEVAIGEVQRDGAETVAAAAAWLASQPSSKLFVFLHLYEPHTPYAPPERFRQYEPYDGEVAYSDELVGRLVSALKQKGLYEPALIVLLSDHGEGLGDHGEQEHGLFLYRETTHVPLIVKLPGQRESGRRVGAPVQHIDLVPTILDAVGAARPAGLARSIAGAAAVGRGHSRAGHLRGGALLQAPFRLERTLRADRFAVPVHPRSARRTLRHPGGSRASASTWRPRVSRRASRCGRRWRSSWPARRSTSPARRPPRIASG